MQSVEHIGIAVKDLATSIPIFERLLNSICYKTELVESEQVYTAFLKTGDTKIELLQSGSRDGVINSFIENRGEGIHHLAIAVEDIKSEMERLKAAGFELINSEPKRGADNKLVCFLHPKTSNGVLIELCQEIR
jgi:methylmalonyl-CoA/ethylmalonyl-CoA epimerase